MKHQNRLWALGAVAAATLAAFAGVSGAGAQQEQDVCKALEKGTEGEAYCELSIEKVRVSGSPINVGNAATFEITVTNTGTVPLTNIGVGDSFDQQLSFNDASIPPDEGPDSGLVVWDSIDADDSDGPDVLDAGDSLKITVTFDAVAATDSAQNCALAYADVYAGDQVQPTTTKEGDDPDAWTEFDCDDVRIVKGGGGGGGGGNNPDPTSTPRDGADPDEPEGSDPTPTSTPSGAVAPATVVPTPPAGVIIAPDTGSGAGGGAGAQTWLLAALALTAAIIAGLGVAAHRRAR
jgi:uncharacterized repeat protein (TIGR01451 family)